MGYANYSRKTYDMRLAATYTDTNATTPDRDKTITAYVIEHGGDGTKLSSSDSGLITLPIYEVSYNLSATGNLMPAGHFSFWLDDPSNYNGFAEAATAPFGSISGYYVRENNGYSTISSYDFNNIYNDWSGLYYTWDGSIGSINGRGTRSEDSESGNVLYSYHLGHQGDYVTTSRDGDVWSKTLTASIEWNESIPNGLFYSILPFIVLLVVGTLGIVIIKKKSIKTDI